MKNAADAPTVTIKSSLRPLKPALYQFSAETSGHITPRRVGMAESVQLSAAAPVVADINNATLNQAVPFMLVKKVQLKLRSATKAVASMDSNRIDRTLRSKVLNQPFGCYLKENHL